CGPRTTSTARRPRCWARRCCGAPSGPRTPPWPCPSSGPTARWTWSSGRPRSARRCSTGSASSWLRLQGWKADGNTKVLSNYVLMEK
ncbi:unnamed protein product, partial [Heterosigma akashiwo]